MTASLPAGHWHAYAYTGERGYVPDHEREVLLDPVAWLLRPAHEIVATLAEPEDAEAWMRQQLAANPATDAQHGYLSAPLYLRERLHEAPPRTAWSSYWDRHGRYVLRLLAACPQPPGGPYGWEGPPPPCPLGKPSP